MLTPRRKGLPGCLAVLSAGRTETMVSKERRVQTRLPAYKGTRFQKDTKSKEDTCMLVIHTTARSKCGRGHWEHLQLHELSGPNAARFVQVWGMDGQLAGR